MAGVGGKKGVESIERRATLYSEGASQRVTLATLDGVLHFRPRLSGFGSLGAPDLVKFGSKSVFSDRMTQVTPTLGQ